MLETKIKQSINESVLCWLATVDKNGQPSVSPKEMFVSYGNEHVIIANIASPKSVSNIQVNSLVCVSFVHVFKQKGFKLMGEAKIIEKSNPKYEPYLIRKEILKLTNLELEEVEDILDLLALLAQKHNIYYRLRPNLRDENDNLFIECAFASNSEYLLTSNIRDINSGELKGFEFKALTPKDFYQMWRKEHE